MGESGRARRRLAKRLKLEQYLTNKKPKLDWADSDARKAHLQELVADAKRLLAEVQATALPQDDEGQGAHALLHQLLCQDVERTIAHLVRHGFRRGRYFGQEKVKLQVLWVAAVVNLQRLMALMVDKWAPKPSAQTA